MNKLLTTGQAVSRESLSLLAGNLRLNNAFTDFMKPTMRSALVEALGSWRAEAILGPAPTTTITIRKPPRYTTGSEWMSQ